MPTKLNNPQDNLGIGATNDQGGYRLSQVNNYFYAHPRVLQTVWTGVKYAYDPKTDITLAYYHVNQNQYGSAGQDATCSNVPGRTYAPRNARERWTPSPPSSITISPSGSTSTRACRSTISTAVWPAEPWARPGRTAVSTGLRLQLLHQLGAVGRRALQLLIFSPSRPTLTREPLGSRVFRFHSCQSGAPGLARPKSPKSRLIMASYNIFLLPGDGIGPEVMAEVEKVAAFLTTRGTPDSNSKRGWSAAAPMTRTARRSAKPTWRARTRRRGAARRRRRPEMGGRAL